MEKSNLHHHRKSVHSKAVGMLFVGNEGTISPANMLNVHMHLLDVSAVDILALQVAEAVFKKISHFFWINCTSQFV
jgi:hypothetical protein